MNLRIVSFLSEDSQENVKELVADFAEALLKRGYANDIEDSSSKLKSLITVRENEEVLNGNPEEFFAEELDKSLMTVIPTDVAGVHTEQSEQEEKSD